MNITICSLRKADNLLMTREFDALISIGHPDGTEHCQKSAKHRLDLGFYDTLPGRSKNRQLPQAVHIETLIETVTSWGTVDEILIHCKRGRSRSTACGIIAYKALTQDSDENCVNRIITDFPRSTPNGWLLCLADMILKTKLFYHCQNTGRLKW